MISLVRSLAARSTKDEHVGVHAPRCHLRVHTRQRCGLVKVFTRTGAAVVRTNVISKSNRVGGGGGRRWDVAWTRHSRWARDVPCPAVARPSHWEARHPIRRSTRDAAGRLEPCEPGLPTRTEARHRIHRGTLDATGRGAVLVPCGSQAFPLGGSPAIRVKRT